jgi:hypothetical protein
MYMGTEMSLEQSKGAKPGDTELEHNTGSHRAWRRVSTQHKNLRLELRA